MDMDRRSLIKNGSLALAGTAFASAAPLTLATNADAASYTKRLLIMNKALSKRGARYQESASAVGPNVFDCSGLVKWAASQYGIAMPHWTEDQIHRSSALSAVSGRGRQGYIQNNIQNSDLIYFFDSRGVSHHVGFYMNGGQLLSARDPQHGVAIAPLSVFFAKYSSGQVFRFN